MKTPSGIAQLILRLALGIGFILPVMDRLGLLGKPGTAGVAWGNWPNFVTYTHSLMPFLNDLLAKAAAFTATLAEVVFGICLILGFRTKEVALGAGLLTATFGICMAFALGIGAPFNYPVFVFTGAALVLSGIESYKWSIDSAMSKKA